MPEDLSSQIVPADNSPADPPAESPAESPHGDDKPIVAAGAGDKSPLDPAAAAPGLSPASAAARAQQADRQKTVISQRPPVSSPAFRRAASPFEMGETLAGEQLGHFQLEEFVGGGGMGAVFRATDTMLGRTVAVKVLSREQTNDDTLRRFKNEAQSAARLDHPNIARVYYVGEDKGWNYIVFEYIEGVNVRDLVEHSGPLAIEDTISYALQIAEALEHASQRDVTHRDIKPSNILIMIDGQAKLVDMGLARLQQVESSTNDLTASGVTLGTFDYISPEQARDPRNTDVRSDLYSLGCTLFFMLTGQPPFPDGTVLQKLLSHSSDTPPDLCEYRPDVDEEVASIINKLLAKQPDQRFQTPRELIGELLLLADRLDLSGIRARSTVWITHSQPKPAWWVRHLPWLSAVGALLLVVLVYNWIDSATPMALPPSPQLATGADEDKPAVPLEPSGMTKTLARDNQVPTATPGAVSEGGQTDSMPAATSESGTRMDHSSGSSDAETPPAQSPDSASALIIPTPKSEPKPATDATHTQDAGGAAERGDRSPPPAATTPSSAAKSPSDLSAVQDDDKQLIVVTDHELAADENAIVVSSLAEALTRVANTKTRAEVELRFDGLRMLQPVVVDTDRFPGNRLTIRAGQDSTPVLAFRSPADAVGSASAMIHILGGQVSWQGVHFYMELPTDAQPREGLSLLRLDTTDVTTFRNCTFTIRNVGTNGSPTASKVAFLDVVGPGEFGGLLLDSRPLAGDTPTIWLEDCIARGQAPFVRAEFAVPFSFSWEHGLFISTQRLVEVGGALFEPRWEHGGVNIFLKRLLSVADLGIGLIHSDQVAPYPLRTSINCDACLFATQATSPATPLYVIRTGSALVPDVIPLDIHGNRNYYKNTQVVLRLESLDDRKVIEQYSFDDLTGPDSPSWYNEKGPEPAAIFSWEMPSQSVDRQTLDDFIPPSIGNGWFTLALALSPSQLPKLPDIQSMLHERPLPAGSPSSADRSMPSSSAPRKRQSTANLDGSKQ